MSVFIFRFMYFSCICKSKIWCHTQSVYQNRYSHRYSSLMNSWRRTMAFLSFTQIIVIINQMYQIHNTTLAKMKSRLNELLANGQIAYISKLKTKSKLARYLNKVEACSQWSASAVSEAPTLYSLKNIYICMSLQTNINSSLYLYSPCRYSIQPSYN